MSSAQYKKAADYEAPKNVPDNRSAEEVSRDLERVRSELTDTVNELAARLDPKNLKEDVKVAAQEKLTQTKNQAQNLVSDAKSGDKKALAILGGIGAGVALLVLRKIMK
ncbi:DUF3618 domain-containing protein [Trueperella sp. LYQ143]|uniref:DUF3618 domain-containing protein n=1 Tax=unclassified Trueperella TaxID=2630174 RepID=UPI00398387DC